MGEARARPAPRLRAAGQILYAIGDVHGCLDALLRLEAAIAADADRSPGRDHLIVLLGDLVDRGPSSADVIDHVLSAPPEGCRRIALAGNHEEAMLAAFDSDDSLDAWFDNGGLETLASYGLTGLSRRDGLDLARIRRAMAFAVPQAHRTWLGGLPQSLTWMGYHLVHAGVRPGVPLDRQSLRDATQIREPFLSSSADFGAVVVHGHTPAREPALRHNRIGIDTGCYATDVLTAARLDGTDVRFIAVS